MIVLVCRSSTTLCCATLVSFLSPCYAATISASHADAQRIQSLKNRKAELIAELKRVEERLDTTQERTLGKAEDIVMIADGQYCSNNIPFQGWDYTKESCAAQTLKDSRCSSYFYMNVNAGQCKCATDACTSRGTSSYHTIFMVTKKADYCGYAGQVPPDTDQNCAYWARMGECQKESYMCENCATSCHSRGSCGAPGQNIPADTNANCAYWAQRGECDKKSYMCENCATSCSKATRPESNEGIAFWHHMFREVAADEGNQVGQLTSSKELQCENACDSNPSCNSIARCGTECYLKDKKVTGLEPRKPNPHCQTLFKSSQGYVSSNPALLRPSSSQTYTFHVYWAGSSKDFNPDGSLKFVLGNNDMSSLAASLWYLHNEVIFTCDGSGFLSSSNQYPWGSRKFAIDRIKRLKITMKPTQPLSNKGMKYSLFKAFDHGEATGPHAFGPGRDGVGSGSESLPEWNQFGYTVGCRHPADHSKDFASSRKYPGSMWYSMPGPCPTRNRNDASEDCKKEYPGGLCDSPTGQGNCTWFYEDVGMIDIDELVGIKPRWKNRAEFCSQCHLEGNANQGGGCGLNFWGPNIWDVSANQRRIDKLLALFKQKYPTIDHLEPPACDFDMARYKR